MFTSYTVDMALCPTLLTKWALDAKRTRACEFDQRRLYIAITLDAAILWHMRRIVRRVLLARVIDIALLFMSGAMVSFNLGVTYHCFMRLADPTRYPSVGFTIVGSGLAAALALIWLMRSWREDWRYHYLQIGAKHG